MLNTFINVVSENERMIPCMEHLVDRKSLLFSACPPPRVKGFFSLQTTYEGTSTFTDNILQALCCWIQNSINFKTFVNFEHLCMTTMSGCSIKHT